MKLRLGITNAPKITIKVLASLQMFDYSIVAFVPGISEGGALLPLFGLNWKSVLAVAAVFGVLYLGSGRKISFTIWATFVGLAYGVVADNKGIKGVGDGSGMGPTEAAMFTEVLLRFRLEEKFEEEFYIKLMLEFIGRRDRLSLLFPYLEIKLQVLKKAWGCSL